MGGDAISRSVKTSIPAGVGVAKEMGVIDQQYRFSEQQSLAFADFRAGAKFNHSPPRRAK